MQAMNATRGYEACGEHLLTKSSDRMKAEQKLYCQQLGDEPSIRQDNAHSHWKL